MIDLAPKARPLVEPLVAGRPVLAEGLALELPKLAETGNSVPLRVELTEAGATLRRFHVLLPDNPVPEALVFHGSRAARPLLSTRVRLATTQTVVVLAELDDDSLRIAQQAILVTLGACAENIMG